MKFRVSHILCTKLENIVASVAVLVLFDSVNVGGWVQLLFTAEELLFY